MRRIVRRQSSKKAITLVELIVAMALTAIFAATCVALIYPVERIYTHTNDLSRAQLMADTVVDALRTECARTYISASSDVWISSSAGDAVMSSVPGSTASGPVLVMRKNYDYCETLAANYAITGALCNSIYAAENNSESEAQTGIITSRAIYRMFGDVPAEASEVISPEGYLHFGFFKVGSDLSGGPYPGELYDFTDPFTAPTYGDYTVELRFHDIGYSSSNSLPVYVLVDVMIYNGDSNIYTRSDVALSFASPTLG